MKKTLLAIMLLLPLLSNAQIINTVAGTGVAGYSGDGAAATAAQLNRPPGVILSPKRSETPEYIYIADYINNAIRRISTTGIISTIAGTGTSGYSGNGGPATAAELGGPTHLFQDSLGNVYISEFTNNVIRRVDVFGIISTIVGNGTAGYSGDGGPATAAQLHGPSGIVMDPTGNIYIADYTNNVIRMVNTSGIISTVAGNNTAGYSGDGGPATAAKLWGCVDVFTDLLSNVYIADGTNSCIRKVNTSGQISTIAGTGVNGYNGDGIPATAAELYNPYGVVVDENENVYIADQNNNRIRMINTSGIISTLAGNGVAGYSGDGGLAISAQLYIPSGVCLDHNGYIYIADQWNNRIRKFSVCVSNLTGQPVADTVNSGSTATFSVSTSFGTSYQWQEDPGTGFVDLANVWPYSGVTTGTLTINNASTYLNATHYRCVVNGISSCPDTSFGAILIVKPTTSINQLSTASINVYPNPAHDNIVIELPYAIAIGSALLLNETGQQVAATTIAGKTASLNVHGLPAGMYFIKMEVNGQVLYKKITKN